MRVAVFLIDMTAGSMGTSAAAQASRDLTASAQKWGGVHTKMMANSTSGARPAGSARAAREVVEAATPSKRAGGGGLGSPPAAEAGEQPAVGADRVISGDTMALSYPEPSQRPVSVLSDV